MFLFCSYLSASVKTPSKNIEINVQTWQRPCALQMPSSQSLWHCTDCADPRISACSQWIHWQCVDHQTGGTWQRLGGRVMSSYRYHSMSKPDISTLNYTDLQVYRLTAQRTEHWTSKQQVTVGLAFHWPCIIDSVVHPVMGSKAASTPAPTVMWTTAPTISQSGTAA